VQNTISSGLYLMTCEYAPLEKIEKIEKRKKKR
jgi:hypothetical protein